MIGIIHAYTSEAGGNINGTYFLSTCAKKSQRWHTSKNLPGLVKSEPHGESLQVVVPVVVELQCEGFRLANTAVQMTSMNTK